MTSMSYLVMYSVIVLVVVGFGSPTLDIYFGKVCRRSYIAQGIMDVDKLAEMADF